MSNITPSQHISPVISALIQLGLAKNEAELYELLLNHPDATIPLLTQKSVFSRTMLYYILDNLIKQELVSLKKIGKKTVYAAEPPEKLQELIDRKEKEVLQQKNIFAEIKDILGSEYRLAHHKPGIRFYEGKDGFKEALYDTLTTTETIYSIVDADAVQDHVAEINTTYVKKRYEARKKKKILLLDTPRSREYLKDHPDDELTETRFLPKNIPLFHTGVQIYDKKILYQTLRADNIISVLINDPDINQLQRGLFEMMWEAAKARASNTTKEIPKRAVTVFGE
jgi:sugar-specific transcriptional regulator TrmB